MSCTHWYAAKLTGLLLLGFGITTILPAAEIYHWVDENGVSHYSQYKPDSSTTDFSSQKMETTESRVSGDAEDVYNVEAHEKKMAEWRESRQIEREELRERKSQVLQQPQIIYNQPQQSRWYPRGYYNHRPPNPEHPIAGPRPPPSILPNPPSIPPMRPNAILHSGGPN